MSGKVYLAFSPNIAKSSDYAEIFSDGIQALRNSGKLETILARYGLTYWE